MATIPSDHSTPQESQKRSATAAGLATPGGRTVKRRASKACQCCRARKVRCNVVEHGAPCTNCRLDEVECIITESKRRKKFWSPRGVELESQSPAPVAHDKVLANASAPLTALSPAALSLDGLSDKDHSALCSDFHPDRQNSYMSLPSLTNSTTSEVFWANPLLSRSPVSHELPRFFKKFPQSLSSDDIDYLSKKGCTSIPPPQLRDEIMRCYVEYVHPFMPLLNLRDLDFSKENSVSLLLFQAIMFAGVTFVPLDLLQRCGYPNKKDARQILFNRTKLLYDFEVEKDRLTLIQALVLMSYWYETPDDQKDTWHWLGIAVSLAHTIGLHRTSEPSSVLDSQRQKLWRRMWWCLLMRDRLVAIGMRRPTRIDIETCNVPMLTLDDFEIVLSPHSNDLESQRKLAVLCIEKAKLCVCISHVLATQYQVNNPKRGRVDSDGNAITTMTLATKKSPDAWQVKACSEELSSWFEALPSEAKYSTGPDSFVLHQALLQMFYYTIVGALHRPLFIPNGVMPVINDNPISSQSRVKVRHAATEISKILRELHTRNLARFLPSEGVTVLLPTLIIHLLDVKSSDQHLQKTSMRSFTESMQVLQNLREMYNAADYAAIFLEAAIGKVTIKTVAGNEPVSLTTNPAVFAKRQQQHPELTFSLSAPELSSSPMLDPTLTPPPETSPDMRKLTIAEKRNVLLGLGITNIDAPSSMCNTEDIFGCGLASAGLGLPSNYDSAFDGFDSDPFMGVAGGLYDSGHKTDLGMSFDLDWIKESSLSMVDV